MILKCKMCGGDIELSADKTCGMCSYCGSTMTFPKVDDEQRANRFNRGNQFRRAGEFDKALAVYERIVQEDENDAEAHWCCALCRFGIEYVEDPNTFEYLPTCHRASFDSFLEDPDYLAALEHSDGVTRRQYQKDAQKIAEVQRGILATSQNEEPFDVFICYKETEDDGSRTRDSLYAQDIYYQLTEQGRRVFFSRITLEDKAGTEYEPYIFAALNSARVMILVTTSAEHANAVWVKNEWSRFLSLMRKDRSKLLLPCYRDMDPYDLPEALSVLQSYDMTKIGFIQDLTRGVNKVLNAAKPQDKPQEKVVVQQRSSVTAAPLLERAFMFLEDGDWAKADDFCEQVLNLEPQNALAYLGKLMAELQIRTQDGLKDADEPFDDSNNFQKAYRFGDDKLKAKLSMDITFINKHKENAQEEAKRKVLAVVRALKESTNSKSGPTLEERLAAAKMKAGYLERILNVFDTTQSQIQALQSEFNAAVSQERELADQRSRLGIFAGKEKKRIGEELAVVSARKSDLAAQINQNKKTLGNYSSVADIERDLREASNNVNDVETQIISAQENADHEYSFKEALNIYLKDPDITRAVNTILYPTMSRDSIAFGRFIQQKNDSTEPIEWQVLARENDRILVISRYALDCQQYNVSRSSITWETCSLRKWLNGTFLRTAFSEEEKAMIPSVTVSADMNPCYSTNPGNSTTDQVFLLSITEASEYFSSKEARKCAPTAYAIARGASTSDFIEVDGRATCWWWLRSPGFTSTLSPGSNSRNAVIILDDGSIYLEGKYVDDGGAIYAGGILLKGINDAVRPALWIDFGS